MLSIFRSEALFGHLKVLGNIWQNFEKNLAEYSEKFGGNFEKNLAKYSEKFGGNFENLWEHF